MIDMGWDTRNKKSTMYVYEFGATTIQWLILLTIWPEALFLPSQAARSACRQGKEWN